MFQEDREDSIATGVVTTMASGGCDPATEEQPAAGRIKGGLPGSRQAEELGFEPRRIVVQDSSWNGASLLREGAFCPGSGRRIRPVNEDLNLQWRWRLGH